MECLEIQSELSLYSDGFLAETKNARVKGHLEICPLCHQRLDDIREIKMSMRQMSRPSIPAAFQNQLKRAVRAEILNVKTSRLPLSIEVREWLKIRMMPYSVGVAASLVLGFTFLSMMFTGLGDTGQFSARQGQYRTETTLLASNKNPFRERDAGEISAYDYAQTRLDISRESPSVNPQGALVALTKSLVRGGMKDDEVVVVADVFGNGLAQIAEVVEPSRDSQALAELQKALDNNDPAYAPFVSANLDNRSDSVRVVLKFQSVSVSTGLARHPR